MEILVEILRGKCTRILSLLQGNYIHYVVLVSENPQTFNQCLLLIASLAHLAPEFVMQNVMPIFTFMGSNVFHRDDSYSFRVVEKVFVLKNVSHRIDLSSIDCRPWII